MKKKTLVVCIGSALLLGAAAVAGFSVLASEQNNHEHTVETPHHMDEENHNNHQDANHEQMNHDQHDQDVTYHDQQHHDDNHIHSDHDVSHE